jgi:hypothetical protein
MNESKKLSPGVSITFYLMAALIVTEGFVMVHVFRGFQREEKKAQQLQEQLKMSDQGWPARAVKEGHAVWVPGLDGTPEFKWLPPCMKHEETKQ